MAYISFDELAKYEDNAAKYIDKHYADAKTVQNIYGMDFRILLTVSACETGWGSAVKGNNYFGIKYGATQKQLITTTEYSTNPNLKFPVIISKTEVVVNGKKIWKYIVKDNFTVYESSFESFKSYYNFLAANPRYKTALEHKNNPIRFFEEVAKAGYATAPTYAETLKQVFNSVNKRL